MAAPARTLPGRYAKFLTAVAGNALVYADVTWGAANRWVELATFAAVALGVMAVPNSPAAPPASAPPPLAPSNVTVTRPEKTLLPPAAPE